MIALELRPGPAFFFVINAHALAIENLRVEAGVGTRRVFHIDDAPLHLHDDAVDETLGRYASLEKARGEIGPRRGKPSVEYLRHDAALPFAARASIRS